MSEPTHGEYFCARCCANTKAEAEDQCDGTGFVDDAKIPNCRLWCDPNLDDKPAQVSEEKP